MEVSMQKILIVDDEKNMLSMLERILQQNNTSIEILKASDGKEALKKVKKENPNVVVMDMQMPEMDGLTTFQEIKKIQPRQLVIMMTGHGNTNTAIEAMKLGAYDYVTKPFDTAKMVEIVNAALKASAMMTEVVSLEGVTDAKDVNLNVRSIIGMSAPMQEVYKTIGQVSGSSIPVLIIGESGTGKELIARAIYHNSNRNNKTFLAINCAAIPDTLLEAELFGYEKGSFTGANERKIGKFELCNGGTIFLDEIGDMPMQTQAKILRVLQEHELERVGGNETIKVDVRVISATNKDLKKQIQDNKFREDLFYRLNVIQIDLPSLRERKEDLPDLIAYFMKRFNYEFGKNISEIPKKTMEQLVNYQWTGNVRELENVMKRAVVTTIGKTLKLDHSLLANRSDGEPTKASAAPTPAKEFSNIIDKQGSFEELLDSLTEAMLERMLALSDNDKNREDLMGKLEKLLIIKTLDKLKGNQVQTAKLLGITRNTLRSRIEEFKK